MNMIAEAMCCNDDERSIYMSTGLDKTVFWGDHYEKCEIIAQPLQQIWILSKR